MVFFSLISILKYSEQSVYQRVVTNNKCTSETGWIYILVYTSVAFCLNIVVFLHCLGFMSTSAAATTAADAETFLLTNIKRSMGVVRNWN